MEDTTQSQSLVVVVESAKTSLTSCNCGSGDGNTIDPMTASLT